MATDRQVIRTENGVVLTKVTLRSGAFPVSETFIVSSKRTPEVPNFEALAAAEAYFTDEVARSGSGRA